MSCKIDRKQYPLIVKRFVKGDSARDIAKDYGVSKIAIYRILNIYHVKLKNNGRQKIDPKFFPLIRLMYENGDTTREIGKRFNVSRTCISNILHKMAVKTREAPYKVYPDQYSEIKKEYEKVYCAKKMADKYGIHPYTMGNILKRNGIRLDRQRINPKFWPLIVERYLTRKQKKPKDSIAQIARDFKVYRSTIDRILKLKGVKGKVSQVAQEKREVESLMEKLK